MTEIVPVPYLIFVSHLCPGMLASASVIDVVAPILEQQPQICVVLDPVRKLEAVAKLPFAQLK